MALKEEVSMQPCINILFFKVVEAFCSAWLVPLMFCLVKQVVREGS